MAEAESGGLVILASLGFCNFETPLSEIRYHVSFASDNDEAEGTIVATIPCGSKDLMATEFSA